MTNHDFILVMPVFNEEDGIGVFLKSLIDEFGNRCLIIVVDDKSTDKTLNEINLLQNKDSIVVVELPKNLGHGGAFVQGLNYSLQYKSDIIITADGDGQITPKIIQDMFNTIKVSQETVLELVRVNRLDGKIRKLISFITRILVLVKSGRLPKDANTPFRAYNQNTMIKILELIPQNTLVPNLWISIFVRRKKMKIIEMKRKSQPRTGVTKIGSSWNGGIYSRYKKLMIFSSKAAFEIFRNK